MGKTAETTVLSAALLIWIAFQNAMGEYVRVSPSTLDAYVGDPVTMDCRGNNGKVEYFIKNRVAWTFTDNHGNTTTLTYGFYPAPKLQGRFNHDKYDLDYGTVTMANEEKWVRFRLNITAAYTGDSGTYACLLMASNGSEISRDQMVLNVTDTQRPPTMAALAKEVNARVGDNVTVECAGSYSDWTYYIHNKPSWTFTSMDGRQTRNLTLGFHSTPEMQQRFDANHYNLEYRFGRSGNTYFFRYALHMKALFPSDSGTYTCSLTADNGTIVNKDEVHVNISLDGGWSDWTSWSGCPVTCGSGQRSRHRACNTPVPAHGGLSCNGEHIVTRPCTLGQCPVDGGWSSWQPWSGCSATCGPSVKHRKRICSNPTPAAHGNSCVGNNLETILCRAMSCRVDGGWGSWQSWSSCSATCGSGSKYRSRTCSNPVPISNGHFCPGSNNGIASCYIKSCPGVWSDWNCDMCVPGGGRSWGTCTRRCLSGVCRGPYLGDYCNN